MDDRELQFSATVSDKGVIVNVLLGHKHLWEVQINKDDGDLKLWILDQNGCDVSVVLEDKINFKIVKAK